MKILAIDGNSIMNRAFYGIRILTNSKGFYTNAITGFLNIYLKESAAVRPDCVAVAFDLKAPTFRHKKAASYKANRKGMPDELAMQMPKIKEILAAMGVKIIETEGFEADDILGTISRVFANSGNECVILTGDRDSLQLVNDKTTVRLATNKETVVYTPEKVKEVYGVEPISLIEVKALMGDSSDNISGVAGIGEKTALSLVQQYGSVDNIYENLEEKPLTKSVMTKLINGKDDAYLSRFLGTISLFAPISENITDYENPACDNEKLTQILTDLEMFKALEKLTGGVKDSIQTAEIAEKKVKLKKFESKTLDAEVINSFAENDTVCFLFDGQKLELFHNDIIYCGCTLQTQQSLFEEQNDSEGLVLAFFASSCKKVCFEGKTAYKFVQKNGYELNNLSFICDLAGYLLNSQASDYTIEHLCAAYKIPYRSDMGEYADIASLYALYTRLETEIELKSMQKLLYEIEQPLCKVLAAMEVCGVMADADGIKDFGVTLSKRIAEIEKDIYALSGHEFNISSPKQLGVVLFEELALKGGKKTKSGYSTKAEVLEALIDKHPIIPLILEYRTLTKLMSTYVDGLLKEIASDGRVHSVFKQTETRTGRISSTNPNLQNIPVRKEIGRNMRKFFVAPKGKVLIDADYSQIELRVLASVCGDENMKNAFLSGSDIHTRTAAQVFNIPEDFVTPEMRRAAKAVNFGIIYGIGAFSLSNDIGVTVAEAKNYIENYLHNFPKVRDFMNKTVADAEKDGFVTTIFGRRRYIPELSSSNKNLQAFGKRAAMNAPIQGAAADIIKIAMVSVFERLKAEKIAARLILQVHDELIIEADEDCAEKAAEILKEQMESCVKLEVPLTVEVKTGKSWYDTKE